MAGTAPFPIAATNDSSVTALRCEPISDIFDKALGGRNSMWTYSLIVSAGFLLWTPAGADENWRLHGGAQTGRFSALDEINEKTVSRLGLVWSKELGTTRGLEATPLVDDGVIYTTAAWNIVHAFSARTGDLKWTFDPKVARERAFFICCDTVNRGVALHNGKVYTATLDGRLIALDRRTGAPVWSVQTTDPAKAYSITAAPTIAKDKVVIGNSGSEYGVRGYITAYDAETGKQVWRFYTVPGDPKRGFESAAMEAATQTWKGKEWWNTGGGGSPWEGSSYDADLDLVYFRERQRDRLVQARSAAKATAFTPPAS